MGIEDPQNAPRDASAVVVGGLGGVGRRVADRLIADGYRVVVGSRRAADRDNGALTVRHLDVTDPRTVDGALDAAVSLAPLEVVVNAHGLLLETPPEAVAGPDLARLLDVNLAGVIRVCDAAASRMRRGAIINVSAVSSSRSFHPGVLAYGASKAGVESVTRAYAVALGPRGIRVNAVVPGPLDHVMGDGGSRISYPDFEEMIRRLVPLGRVIAADEVAEAVRFLASENASGITGATVPVDGGLLAK